jgi:hypothetical protein
MRLRAAVAALGVIVGLVVANIGFSPGISSAVGSTCWNSTLVCYARGTFNDGSAWGGGYVETEVANMSATESSWINQELWVTTNGNSNAYWAEIGYSANQPYCPGNVLRWFLYYQNPNNSYHECFGVSPSVGSWHQLEIQEDTSSQWYIYLDGKTIAIDTGTSGWNYNDYSGLEYHYGTYTNMYTNGYYSYNEVRGTGCCDWYSWDEGGTEAEYPTDYNWIWTSTDPWIHGYDS